MKRGRVLVTGMMFYRPVAGVVYQVLHYLLGLERLGYDAYYVELADWWTLDPRTGEISADPSGSVEVVKPIMERYGFGNRWALRSQDSEMGITDRTLRDLVRSADALLNVTGQWLHDDLLECPLKIYIETDPLSAQIDVANGDAKTIEHLNAHDLHFTFGETIGGPDFPVPLERFEWLPTRQPVALDLWATTEPPSRALMTTVTSWHSDNKDRVWNGETYFWTKDREFEPFLSLPQLRPARFEMAVVGQPGVANTLRSMGWRVEEAAVISAQIDDYRAYISSSWGEFTVARDQYVRPRTGWFSDRSACYLAAGRPVITQETGFSDIIPTGHGLFAIESLEDALAAFDAIDEDPTGHQDAARAIAAEYFEATTVVGDLLERAGLV